MIAKSILPNTIFVSWLNSPKLWTSRNPNLDSVSSATTPTILAGRVHQKKLKSAFGSAKKRRIRGGSPVNFFDCSVNGGWLSKTGGLAWFSSAGNREGHNLQQRSCKVKSLRDCFISILLHKSTFFSHQFFFGASKMSIRDGERMQRGVVQTAQQFDPLGVS